MQTVRAKPPRLSNAAKCLLNDYVHGGQSVKGNTTRGSLKWGPREPIFGTMKPRAFTINAQSRFA